MTSNVFDYLEKRVSDLVLGLLRTLARNLSNIDFCLKILLLKDDELVMPECEKKEGHRLSFGVNMTGRTLESEKIRLVREQVPKYCN